MNRTVQFWIFMGIYIAIVLSEGYLYENHLVPSALRIPLALLPIIPCIFIAQNSVGKIREMDELQRTIQLEALAYSFVFTAIVTLSYGFLQAFANFPNLSFVWVWPILASFWGLGMFIARRKYA